jgi:hypothetical protein
MEQNTFRMAESRSSSREFAFIEQKAELSCSQQPAHWTLSRPGPHILFLYGNVFDSPFKYRW